MLMKFKYEKEFREAHPETIGEKDSAFDLCNYTEWLETKVSRVELPVKPANAEKEIFEYIEELLEGDICNREDAVKNDCGRCRDYWNYRDKRLYQEEII